MMEIFHMAIPLYEERSRECEYRVVLRTTIINTTTTKYG